MTFLSKLFGGKSNSEHKCEDENCSHENDSCEKNVENILDMAENAGSNSDDQTSEHKCEGDSCSHGEEKKECCKG